jgi:hypothetical protein
MTSSLAMPVVDSRIRRIGRLLGWISLFATLALLSPGVVATARADDLAAGPSCPAASAGDEHNVVELEQMIERLRAETAERGDSQGDVVTLNTRGWNYATPVAPPPEQPERR